jgi:2-C-methyl-D-erythritol 4-phosphate cytidylyltransferase
VADRRSSLTVAAILLGAGEGLRLGADVPKAFCLVGGRTLLAHSFDRFVAHPRVRDVVVVVPAAFLDRARELGSGVTVIAGGITRLDSVRIGLAALAADVDAVLVHDVARPFVPAPLIDRVVDALAAGADAVVPGLPVTDTIKEVGAGEAVIATLDRSVLRAIQTPQGFRRAALEAAHTDAPEATDDAGLIEARGGSVVVVAGAEEAFKITRPWDLRVAEAIAAGVREGALS